MSRLKGSATQIHDKDQGTFEDTLEEVDGGSLVIYEVELVN